MTKFLEKSENVTSAIDLSKLPAPKIVEEISFDEILDGMKQQYLEKMKTEYPDYELVDSDPAVKVLETAAYREMMLRQKINDGAKECMLAFSEGSNLDNIVAYSNVERETFSDIDPATGDFRKESDASLRSRSLLSFDRYSTAGAFAAYKFQALKVGAELKLFDVHPYGSDERGPQRLYKVNVSLYFDDEQAFEEKKSTLEGVLAEQKNSGAVSDYILDDRSEGEVKVPLLFSDQSADELTEAQQKELDERVRKIDAHLQSSEVRPLTDRVTVFAAKVVDVPVKAQIFVPVGVDKEIVRKNAVEGLKKYAADRFRVGLDIPLSGLHAALFVPNVNRVKITNMTEDLKIAPDSAPRVTFKEELEAKDIVVEVGE